MNVIDIYRAFHPKTKQKNTHGNVLTDKWILCKEHGIPMIQFMEHLKLKRKEDQRVDASALLRRGTKIIKGSRGWEGLVSMRRGGGEKEGKNQYGKRWRRCTEGQEFEQSCVSMGDGELGLATKKSQMPGK
jgi:hypothetical protein